MGGLADRFKVSFVTHAVHIRDDTVGLQAVSKLQQLLLCGTRVWTGLRTSMTVL